MHKGYDLKPYLAGILFSLLIGFSFLAIKICIPVASTLEILTFRYNFAFIAVIIIFVLKKKKRVIKNKKSLLIVGGTYISFMLLQTLGLALATSIETSIVFATIPIMVQIIAGIFLKEKTTYKQNFFAVLTVFALMVLVIKQSTNIEMNLWGLIVLVISALCMAVNNVLLRYYRGVYTPFEMSSTTVLMGTIVFNIISVIYGIKTGTLSEYFNPLENLHFVLATAYLGIFCILASNTIAGYMFSKLKAVQSSIFGNLSTAISIGLGIVILKEPFYLYHIVCTIMIVIGVIGVNVCKEKNIGH